MNRVKELRERRGLQQKQLALEIGVSRPTVSEWEHGKKDPSGERLLKLAEFFNCEPGTILGYMDERPGKIDDDVQLSSLSISLRISCLIYPVMLLLVCR